MLGMNASFAEGFRVLLLWGKGFWGQNKSNNLMQFYDHNIGNITVIVYTIDYD